MFLHSIQLCGVFNIEKTKTIQFLYNIENTESEDLVNNIKNGSVIEGLLIVLDSKYHSKYNFDAVINRKRAVDSSYVEITFVQNKENTYSLHDWLGKSTLKLKRVLQQPGVIYINKKRCDVNIFHQSLCSIGFQNIHNLCFHRVLDDDIIKLSKLMGDDYWNMLTKVIEHEELIDMVEQKAGIVKKRAIKHSYNIVADTIAKAIPKKVELRNNIYERIQINKNFKTLFYIINERKMQFLESLKDKTNTKIRILKPKINMKVHREHENSKKKHVQDSKIRRNETVLESFKEKSKNIDYMLNNYKGECAGQQIVDLANCFANLKTINKQDLLPTNQNVDSFATKEITAMKKCLSNAAKNNNFDETKEFFDALYKFDEAYLEIVGSDEASTTIIDRECKINKDIISTIEQENLKRFNTALESLLDLYKNAEDRLEKLYHLTADLNIGSEEFQSFLNVEKMIASCPANIKSNYLGPIFFFMDTTSNLDVKMWDEIEGIAKTILFKTRKSLYQFIKRFSPGELAGLTFCAMSEVPKKQYDENVHDSNELQSMKNLVKSDINENVKDVILSLLYDYILVTDPDWNETEEVKNYCVKVYDDICSYTNHRGIVKVRSEWNNIWELLDKSPICAIQEFYNHLKGYVEIELEMSKCEETVEGLNDEMKIDVEKVLNEQINAVCNKTSIEKDKTNLLLASQKVVHEKLGELLKLSSDEFKNMDLTEEIQNIGSFESDRSYFNSINEFIAENGVMVQQIRSSLASIVAASENAYDGNSRADKIKSNKAFKNIATRRDEYEAFINEKCKSIKDLYDSYEVFVDDYTNDSNEMNELTLLYGENVIHDITISILRKLTNEIEEKNTFEFKQSVYDEYKNQDSEVIKNEMTDIYKRIIRYNTMNRIDLKNIDPKSYQSLIESLGKVKEFSKKDIYAPMKVKKRAYPLMNTVVIKIIKDTVHNFTATYNSVLSDYISPSNLHFYTKTSLNETGDENFSWNCFDITRLKAIDFVEKWKNDNRTLPTSCRQLIKSLLLILHIINYISIFKFIIISEKIFENMDEPLEADLRKFLKNISQFVQIILYKERNETENEIQPMETDEIDYLTE